MGFLRSKNRGRYPNVKKPVIDGIRFDSAHEARRYQTLKMMQRAGEISKLQLQVRYPITINGVKVLIKSERYRNGRHLTYVADFVYEKDGKQVIEDAKGHQTRESKIKIALMDAMGFDVKLV